MADDAVEQLAGGLDVGERHRQRRRRDPATEISGHGVILTLSRVRTRAGQRGAAAGWLRGQQAGREEHVPAVDAVARPLGHPPAAGVVGDRRAQHRARRAASPRAAARPPLPTTRPDVAQRPGRGRRRGGPPVPAQRDGDGELGEPRVELDGPAASAGSRPGSAATAAA